MPAPVTNPLKTYVRDVVLCARCNRLDLLKPDTWPNGTGVACPRCQADNALHVETCTIELLQIPLCRTCNRTPLVYVFLPDPTHGTRRQPSCANCQRPTTATARLYAVRRHRQHGYTACQVIARAQYIQRPSSSPPSRPQPGNTCRTSMTERQGPPPT